MLLMGQTIFKTRNYPVEYCVHTGAGEVEGVKCVGGEDPEECKGSI